MLNSAQAAALVDIVENGETQGNDSALGSLRTCSNFKYNKQPRPVLGSKNNLRTAP